MEDRVSFPNHVCVWRKKNLHRINVEESLFGAWWDMLCLPIIFALSSEWCLPFVTCKCKAHTIYTLHNMRNGLLPLLPADELFKQNEWFSSTMKHSSWTKQQSFKCWKPQSISVTVLFNVLWSLKGGSWAGNLNYEAEIIQRKGEEKRRKASSKCWNCEKKMAKLKVLRIKGTGEESKWLLNVNADD